MNTIKSVRLTFTEGTSDKEYNLHLLKSKNSYIVNFEYGRRNGTLKSGTKTNTPVSLEAAEEIFNKILNEKTNEGYVSDTELEKVMSVFYMDTYGEANLFFNGDECLGAVSLDDADWRHEYFNPIMKVMGLKVVSLDKLNKKQLASAKMVEPNFFEDSED